jgi:hypothetical protein
LKSIQGGITTRGYKTVEMDNVDDKNKAASGQAEERGLWK